MKETNRYKPLSNAALKRLKALEVLPEQELMQATVLMDSLAKIAYESKIIGNDNFNHLKNWTPYVKP
jgi:hypothetical protein